MLHSVLPSLTPCQTLTKASVTPRTHSPAIIAPPEFIVCVTCCPSSPSSLVRGSEAFITEVLLYCSQPPQRHLVVRRHLMVALFNTVMFLFFTLSTASPTNISLPAQAHFTVELSRVYKFSVHPTVLCTLTLDIWTTPKERKELFLRETRIVWAYILCFLW